MQPCFLKIISFFSMYSSFISKPDSGPAFACAYKAIDPTCRSMLYREALMYSQRCPCSPVEDGQAGHSLCSGLQGSGSVWALGHLNPLHCTQRLPTVCPLSCGAEESWANSLRKCPGCGLQGKQKGGWKRVELLQFCFFLPPSSAGQLTEGQRTLVFSCYFCCSSSVLFEIWCFRQKKGGQSIMKEKERGKVCVKSEQLLEWLLGILCHIPK